MAQEHRWTTIDVAVSESVAYVRFDRPDHRNGVTPQMATEMHGALEWISCEASIDIVVLTGNGRTFCPGADLSAGRDRSGIELPDPAVYHSARLLHEMPQVTLAAINGACAGAGMAWASACDLRVASAAARFSTAFLEVGLAGELGLAWTLRSHLGGALARDLCFLPRKLSADELLSLGFLSRVFDAESFDREVESLVAGLAAREPRAIRDMKANFVDAARCGLGDYIDIETQRHQAPFLGGEAHASMERLAEHGRQIRTETV